MLVSGSVVSISEVLSNCGGLGKSGVPSQGMWAKSLIGVFDSECFSHTIHGTIAGIFTNPWMVEFYGRFFGKYTSPMDPMGLIVSYKML